MKAATAILLGVAGFCAAGCREERAPPLESLKPKPLPRLDQATPAAVDAGDERERVHHVIEAPVFGRSPPARALRVELHGERVAVNGEMITVTAVAARIGDRPAVLVPDAETYVAQAAPLLAALDESRAKVWIAHPSGRVAFPVVLSDEQDFRRWIDETAAGRIRVVHRSDGFELQTNVGKLPGPDPNGPTVPRRGGRWDIARLREALTALERRFDADTESCIVPSFGMELTSVAEALTAWYTKDDAPLFTAICVVYPRPGTPGDGG